MAKKKQETAEAPTKAFEIMAASIKDDFCNYTYEIKQGVGAGDTHQVKGKGIVDPDMLASFAKLNVHLAVLDDVYAHSGIEIDDIDKFHGHELSTRYTVTGIKVKGDAENKSVILVGTKFITCASGRIAIETPKIPVDKFSSYKWYNELDAAIERARTEVELYKGGKYTVSEPMDINNENQGVLEFTNEEAEG